MAENRAAFSLRRRRSLGFSKCRWLRTVFKVPSRSIFFFNRRRALSTGSPFFNLISVKSQSHPFQRPWNEPENRRVLFSQGRGGYFRERSLSMFKTDMGGCRADPNAVVR